MGLKCIAVISIYMLLSGCANAAPKRAEVMGYSEIRRIYLQVIRSEPDQARRDMAAAEVEHVSPSLFSTDEAVVIHAADILRMAGCESRSALPRLKQALARFPGPSSADKQVLGVVGPSYGPWGAIDNAIAVIESDGRCGN